MHDELNARGPLSAPGQPTNAPPGSERKIRVMIERASRREPLFHPLDCLSARLRYPLPLLAKLAGNRSESA